MDTDNDSEAPESCSPTKPKNQSNDPYNERNIKLEAFESSLSIFFNSWKTFSGRPVWPTAFSWKLQNLKIYEKFEKNSGLEPE